MDAFYFFSLPNYRPSNTMLNKSSESEQPCLVPNFRRIVFLFSQLSMILAVGLPIIIILKIIFDVSVGIAYWIIIFPLIFSCLVQSLGMVNDFFILMVDAVYEDFLQRESFILPHNEGKGQ